MTGFFRTLFITAASLGLLSQTVVADDRSDIRALLERYEIALNASDTKAVMTVYAPDGVFMPQHLPPQIGSNAIQSAYDAIFSAINLDIKFVVDEVVVLSDMWAYARTRSQGSTLIKANGTKVPEGNQELFLLKRQADGAWKVARYIFSTTNPRQ